MPDYEKDVEEEATDFLKDQLEDVKTALVEDGDIDDLRDNFHESVVDRSYSPEDAVFILEACDNEETDSGLFENRDWREQLSARAAYSFGNDVWAKAEEIFEDLKGRVDDAEIDTESEEDIKPEIVEKVLKAWEEETTVQPIGDNPQEELRLLREWARLGNMAGLWGGYPLGGSYIDARCGSGHGMPNVKDFVDFDREVAQKLPNMTGKYKDAILARIKELETST